MSEAFKIGDRVITTGSPYIANGRGNGAVGYVTSQSAFGGDLVDVDFVGNPAWLGIAWTFRINAIELYEEPKSRPVIEEPEDTSTYDLQSFFDDQAKSERWFAFAPLFAGLVVLLLAGLVALFASDAHSASFSARGGGFSSARSFSTSRSYSAPRPSYTAPKATPAPAPVIKRETTIINRTYNNGGGYSGGGSSGFLPGFLGGYLGGTLAQPHYTPAPSAPIIVPPQAPAPAQPQAQQYAPAPVVQEDEGLGFWGWTGLLGFIGLGVWGIRRALKRGDV